MVEYEKVQQQKAAEMASKTAAEQPQASQPVSATQQHQLVMSGATTTTDPQMLHYMQVCAQSFSL